MSEDQGYIGRSPDPTPPQNYTLPGVGSNAPTPRTDPALAAQARSSGSAFGGGAQGAAGPPANMVTTDTEQTITGSKTFERINFYSPTDPGAYGSMSADSLTLGSGDATAGNPSRVVSIFANLSRWNTTTQTSEWAGTPTITAFPGLTEGQEPFWRTDAPFYEAGNRVYSAANLPPAPSNMVTTDTDQSISGTKTFPSTGIRLTAPNGTRYRLVVNNDGTLGTTPA